ncbi:TetR/AcrR family transcriptional regulator [Mycolicibacterium austroafricanum]|uniref:TetR/AcrR family transcriptional regulator n=1 Tax=Mycolicibacterium austroafricanum TaxID=39687 RepID=UPI001CA32D16|nr:TetR/AcrR family transcriptional regulator [Mycolicibacterium austroafricanum]QZT64565.1 TetR/AcrR family transcriptional regulator [Mycolicibacterium austroafricanum]
MRQTERTRATTAALLDAARELFAAHGYETTSLAAVAARAEVTKGAVYHHFDGKRQLFEAVFVTEVDRMAVPLVAAYRGAEDPWQGFAAACRAFLTECLDPGVQRIVLRDAPAALGWEQVRRLEAPLLEMMETAIAAACDAGRIPPRPPALLARFLFGALCETAMVIARADDPGAAHRAAVAEVDRILDGFRD